MSTDTAQLETISVGVPFTREGKQYRVLELRGGVYVQRMPKSGDDFGTSGWTVTTEEFSRQYNKTVKPMRRRTPDDGLGPLIQGDVAIDVPFWYGGTAPGKDPKKNPGTERYIVPSDIIVLGRFDMRYQYQSFRADKDGLRPFLMSVQHGISTISMDAEKLTEMGFLVDWDLLGEPIPYYDPDGKGVISLHNIGEDSPEKMLVHFSSATDVWATP